VGPITLISNGRYIVVNSTSAHTTSGTTIRIVTSRLGQKYLKPLNSHQISPFPPSILRKYVAKIPQTIAPISTYRRDRSYETTEDRNDKKHPIFILDQSKRLLDAFDRAYLSDGKFGLDSFQIVFVDL
jgi:hypothetical protein